MNLNKAILIGRMTADPRVNKVSDKAVCNFTLATNETWTNDGEKKEKSEFHNIVLWGRLAEVVSEYCKKGSLIMVEGKIRTRKYNNKYITEIIGNDIQLGPRNNVSKG